MRGRIRGRLVAALAISMGPVLTAMASPRPAVAAVTAEATVSGHTAELGGDPGTGAPAWSPPS